MKLTIGITEGSDPAFHPEWVENTGNVNGVILITKGLTGKLRSQILEYDEKTDGKIVLHATCTGFGGTALEPNVPKPEEQAENLYQLIMAGFSSERCVWRADPVIPTNHGLWMLQKSLTELDRINCRLISEDLQPVTRIRMSLLDNYKHVKERFENAEWEPLYNGEWKAKEEDMLKAKTVLADFLAHTSILYNLEMCAEHEFGTLLTDRDRHEPYAFAVSLPAEIKGCVSETDLRLMGFSERDIQDTVNSGINRQRRKGCCCLACKKELIPTPGRCPFGCLYCYWKDA